MVVTVSVRSKASVMVRVRLWLVLELGQRGG